MDPGSVIFLLSAVASWLLAALTLSMIASLAVHFLKTGEGTLGYVSSAVTFFASIFAGSAAIRKRRKAALLTGVVSGVAIITMALTLGFLISGKEISLSGVLSLITFTLAGCLVGSVFLPGKHKPDRKRNFKIGKGR